MGELLLCWECRRPGADPDTFLCPYCLIGLPDYFRHQAERFAIHVALLRQHLVEAPMGGVRWTEAQLRDHLRRSQEPAPREEKKPKGKPRPLACGPRTLVFELPLVPMRNAYDRMHFRAKRRLKDQLSALFCQQCPLASGVPLPRCAIEIVRYSQVEPDPDNLHGFVKPILDAMQLASERHPYGASIIENDSSDYIELRVRWEKCPPRKGKVVVLVTPK
jgi:hypothetical protein